MTILSNSFGDTERYIDKLVDLKIEDGLAKPENFEVLIKEFNIYR